MFELTAENAQDYLRTQGWIGNEPAQAETLSGGVSNFVLRVTTPECRFVVKQARPQLRTRDPWFSDLDRIYREQEVMQALHPSFSGHVPEVLHVDRENYVYAMSHAPIEAKVWKTELLAGNIDLDHGKRVGQMLGRMRVISAGRPSDFDAFRDSKVFVQLRVEPFYRRVQERRPEVARAIEPIIQDMLTIKEALCHGDYTPKNILIHDGAFTLVDYETAHLGDPTMDLGLFLAHLTLKSIRAPERRPEFVKLMRAFWKGYCNEVKGSESLRPADLDPFAVSDPAANLLLLERRGVKHCGVCMLARVDGTSPVDYLPEEPKRKFVRRIGRAILLDGVERWEDVWNQLP